MKWYEQNPARFEIEKRLLARHHHGAIIVIKNGRVRVLKKVVGRKDTYSVEAIFSNQHPYSAMEVYIRCPRIKGNPPHMYSKERLCLHDTGDVGPETTAKIYLDWTVQWVMTYEGWRDGKSWPRTNRG